MEDGERGVTGCFRTLGFAGLAKLTHRVLGVQVAVPTPLHTCHARFYRKKRELAKWKQMKTTHQLADLHPATLSPYHWRPDATDTSYPYLLSLPTSSMLPLVFSALASSSLPPSPSLPSPALVPSFYPLPPSPSTSFPPPSSSFPRNSFACASSILCTDESAEMLLGAFDFLAGDMVVQVQVRVGTFLQVAQVLIVLTTFPHLGHDM